MVGCWEKRGERGVVMEKREKTGEKVGNHYSKHKDFMGFYRFYIGILWETKTKPFNFV